ncbi:hypothetical protein BGL34_05515 [Fructilactobacillus lindneri]|uniref:Serine-type D-Ala-D-Ala carboxypeptidase n=2 Tax=Fructilactobacillus lindneri TaxID=53444 RepID=A0A0R2JSD2_9LACO|nr:hypothetical protein AYR60_00540 [Fructilactobacillus lindneri]KRN79982.1 serine-type D-Ala-D-Ala carboxypeptidase [Fructilactobacillus lindneri DSM 20690 = JCM 11027]ANZ58640.1 hypothetical protein AYR59_00540 [Fructilactobacillus lindneri]POG97860.1 hypothetical protein BGL31_04980 [Fructilactobacillus lindneri]POG99192.1 hypothetical protein BGL32_05005 [Fructilactobacillus lindneri]
MKVGKKQLIFPKTLILTVVMTGLILMLSNISVHAQTTTGLVQTHNSVKTPAQTDTAKGEIAIDARTGQIIYQKNAQKKLPIASLSKLMTVYIVIQRIQAHELSWNDKVKISPQVAEISAIPGTTSAGLVSGREYTVRELCDAALIGSASGAAMALGQKISGNSQAFADLMNQTAKKIGIKDATFYNASGLTNCGTHGLKLKNVPEMAVNTMSAKSVAILSKQLLHTDPKILDITKQP